MSTSPTTTPTDPENFRPISRRPGAVRRFLETRENAGVDAVEPTLKTISLLFPDRTLTPEFREVLARGYLRGAASS